MTESISSFTAPVSSKPKISRPLGALNQEDQGFKSEMHSSSQKSKLQQTSQSRSQNKVQSNSDSRPQDDLQAQSKKSSLDRSQSSSENYDSAEQASYDTAEQAENSSARVFKRASKTATSSGLNKKKPEDLSMLLVEDLQARQGLQNFVNSMKKDFALGADDIYSALKQVEQQPVSESSSQPDQLMDTLGLFRPQERASALQHFERWREKAPEQDLNSLLPFSEQAVKERQFAQGLDRLQNDFFKSPGVRKDPLAVTGFAQESQNNQAMQLSPGGPRQAIVRGYEDFNNELLNNRHFGITEFPTDNSEIQRSSVLGLEGELIEAGVQPEKIEQTNRQRAFFAYQSDKAQPSKPLTESLSLDGLKVASGVNDSAAIGLDQAKVASKSINRLSELPSSTSTQAFQMGFVEKNQSASGSSSGDRSFNDDREGNYSEPGASSANLREVLSAGLITNEAFAQNLELGSAQSAQEGLANSAAMGSEAVDKIQTLAAQGGGEMKLALNPEGLGQLQLKVSVNKGMVNVQMVAETAEAKEMISRGLDDLKSSLISQNLNVDQLKVDVSGEISKQLDQSLDQGQREVAQQFLQDFRQGNDFARRQLFEFDSLNPALRQSEDPAGRISSSEAQPSARRKSSRLDLVA